MKEKKNSLLGPIFAAILFALFIVFILVAERDVLFDNATDLYDMLEEGGPVKDKYVELYVDGVIGNYAETKHYTNLIPTGTDQHFMVWLQTDEIISLTIQNKNAIEKLNKICDDTWDYIESDSEYYDVKGTSVKGVIKTIDPEIKGYYNEWIDEVGIGESGMPVYYVTIDATETQGKMIFYLIFSIVAEIISVASIVITVKKKKEAEEFAKMVEQTRVTNFEE